MNRKGLSMRSLRFGNFLCAIASAASLLVPAASAAAPSRPEDRLSIKLPEVVIVTPDIARIIASRLRPSPPKQLGIRLPDILAQARLPSLRLPPRPIPKEAEPNMALLGYLGAFARVLGNDRRRTEIAFAFLKKGALVEALSFFKGVSETAGDPLLRAKALFWSAEVHLRMGREGRARALREKVAALPLRLGGVYPLAARYALAEERCRKNDYLGCLQASRRWHWKKGDFAEEEVRLMRAWALDRLGKWTEARDIYSGLAAEGGAEVRRAAVALGHIFYRRKDYLRAEASYTQVEAMGPPKEESENLLVGEALHGIGWARLRMGRPETAGRAFALFFQRHKNHPLRESARVGALAARIETDLGKVSSLAEILGDIQSFADAHPENSEIGPLRLQVAWGLFRRGRFRSAAEVAAAVSDAHPLGQVYRLGRVVEGLSLYHLGQIRKAFGILRSGAEKPPRGPAMAKEQSIARTAALATAFAAFRLNDFTAARVVLEHWAFPKGAGRPGAAVDAEAALWFGEAAFEAGDLEKAHRAFASIPRGKPQWYRARAGIAWIYYRKREWKKAARAFDEVFGFDSGGPLAAEALARAGEARFNMGDSKGALEAFDRIEREYEGKAAAREALFQKGKLLFRRDRIEEAEAAFRRYLKNYPDGSAVEEVKYLRALIPFRRGQYQTARSRLKKFVEDFPQSPFASVAYLRVADSYYNEGAYGLADVSYRLMMQRFPESPRIREAAYGLVLSHLQRNDSEQFLASARAFIARYPGDDLSIALAFQIGEHLLARGRLDDALRAYRELETRYGESNLAAHAILQIAHIYRRKKEVDAAIAAYESLLTRFPDSPLRPIALFGEGETMAKIGRCQEALDRLGRYLSLHPDHGYVPFARYEAGRCAVKLGQMDVALAHLRKVIGSVAVGRHDLKGRAALLMAAILVKKGETQEAERVLETASRSPETDVAVEAAYSRAELLARRKDPRAPIEFIKLTYQYPKEKIWVARALARAGELYEEAGRRATALRIFQKMREVASAGALRDKAEKALKRLRGSAPSR